jgi:predicted ester cyclase
MSDPEAIIRQWFRDVWSDGSEEAIDRLMAPDALVHNLGPAVIRGPEGFKPLFRVFQSALSNMHVDVVRTIVEGDMVAAHCHVTGRHTGDAFGAAATGSHVDFWGITIARVLDGRVVEGWNSFDFLTMYQQIGWVPQRVLP